MMTDKEQERTPHVHEEGSRSHVISWSAEGRRCSEPNCEINAPDLQLGRCQHRYANGVKCAHTHASSIHRTDDSAGEIHGESHLFVAPETEGGRTAHWKDLGNGIRTLIEDKPESGLGALVERTYPLSRDYQRLWSLIQTEKVACWVDYPIGAEGEPPLRDIAEARLSLGVAQIGVRGVCYVYASDGMDDFCRQCERSHVEFIDPEALRVEARTTAELRQESERLWRRVQQAEESIETKRGQLFHKDKQNAGLRERVAELRDEIQRLSERIRELEAGADAGATDSQA